MTLATMADVSYEIMERNGLSGDDISWLVPHQANLRIIDATANRMGVTREKVMINIEKYGNTTAATMGCGKTRDGRSRAGLSERGIRSGGQASADSFSITTRPL